MTRRSVSMQRWRLFGYEKYQQTDGAVEREDRETRALDEHIKNLPKAQMEILMTDDVRGTLHSLLHVRAPEDVRVPRFIPQLYPTLRQSREDSAGANLRFKTPELVAVSRRRKIRRMVVRGKLLSVCVLAVGLAFSSARAGAEPHPSQSRTAKASSTPSHPLYTRQGTWYEFLLKQFNPNDIDYGQWLENERQVFLEARLRNPYFVYCAATTLALLVMGIICAKLRIDHRRAMWITAEMMGDLYNQDAYSRKIAQEAIERYNTHIERCNRAIEAAEHGDNVSGKGSEIEQLKRRAGMRR